MARAISSLKLINPFSKIPSPTKPITFFPKFFTFFSTISSSNKKKHFHNNYKSSSSKKKSALSATGSASASSEVKAKKRKEALEGEKRRTRSDKHFNLDEFINKSGIDKDSHFPVLLGEVLDVFECSSSFRLRSFVDCTLGAAGHSCAIIHAHPELQTYIGLDVDPIAHNKAQSRINDVLQSIQSNPSFDLKTHVILKNFKDIKQVLHQVDEKLLSSGIDGILMDLGMSSMQVDDAGRGFSMLNNGPLDMRMDPKASLKAEDILNSWPATEVGRILREYGEESNWYFLQNKIVKARLVGGLHSTGDLVELIRSTTYKTEGGRQGWIKTAARVFQALRIAVNDELKILELSLHSCFDCLRPGGRLAVISFHSLEDRIVKQTFLKIVNYSQPQRGDILGEVQQYASVPTEIALDSTEKEPWIKQVVKGAAGMILTKRPITASTEEERINSRCRSAKLRVIQKY